MRVVLGLGLCESGGLLARTRLQQRVVMISVKKSESRRVVR